MEFLLSKLVSRNANKVIVKSLRVPDPANYVILKLLGDFGLATTAYAELDTEKTSPMDENCGSMPPGQSIKINLTGHVGTHLYMSPEQVKSY